MEAPETASDPQNYQQIIKKKPQTAEHFCFSYSYKKQTWQFHSHCGLVTDHMFTVKQKQQQQQKINKQLCYSITLMTHLDAAVFLLYSFIRGTKV